MNARVNDADATARALTWLCEAYWYPIYAYIRRRGNSVEDARDLTQDFFTRLLEKPPTSADRERGRFRAFLLACCKNFLANEADRRNAQVRGGGARPYSLDSADAEKRYSFEPVDDHTPESLYNRRWALTILEMTLDELGREYHRDGKGSIFEALKGILGGDDRPAKYAEIASSLGKSEASVKKAAQRLRERYKERLTSIIADSVSSPSEIEEELRLLLLALRS